MQRICPFCGESQFIPDEKVANAWALSRCHACKQVSVLKSTSPVAGSIEKPMAETTNSETNLADPLSLASVKQTLSEAGPSPDLKPLVQPPEFLRQRAYDFSPRLEDTENVDGPDLSGSLDLPNLPNLPNLEDEEPQEAARSSLRFFSRIGYLPKASAVFLMAYAAYSMTHRSSSSSSSEIPLGLKGPIGAFLAAPSPAPEVAPPLMSAALEHEVQAPFSEKTLAPDRVTDDEISKNTSPIEKDPESRLIVQVVKRSAILRAGPGLNYRKIGTVPPAGTLRVKDWHQEWFEVEPVKPDLSEGALPLDAPTQAVWIRNDLVRKVEVSGG